MLTDSRRAVRPLPSNKQPRVVMPTKHETELIQTFRQGEGPPPWAWPIPPSVPLVGERFEPGAALMVYASAENLTWMNSKRPRSHPHHFEGESAWNRYRNQFEDATLNDGRYFPHVGIQPVSNGGLLCAAYHTSCQLGLPVDDDPRLFIEHISLTNWGKFTVHSERNEDYAGNPHRLERSLALVESELRLLQPGVVLLPQSIWRVRSLRSAMIAAAPKTRFVAAYQFNATVVHTRLGLHAESARELQKSRAGTPLAAWMARLNGLNRDHAWRYLVHLDDALRAT